MQLLLVLFLSVLAFGQNEMKTLDKALGECKECSDAVQKLFTAENLRSFGDKPFTLLVPNNAAIMKEQSALSMIPKEELTKLIKFHVLDKTVAELKEGPITSLEGSHTVTKDGENFKVDDAKVIGKYHAASNGQGFYVIDQILARNATDKDKAEATQNIIRGQPRTLGQQGQGQQGQGQQGQGQTLLQLIQADPQLSQISQMIQQVPSISQLLTGPLTFFFPNNNAITSVQQALSQLQGQRLEDLIRYHVVFGAFPELQDQVRLATFLQCGDLNVRRVGDGFVVNDANVIGTYRRGTNNQGYYVIDKVLTPRVTQCTQPASSQQGGSGQVGQGGSLGGAQTQPQ